MEIVAFWLPRRCFVENSNQSVVSNHVCITLYPHDYVELTSGVETTLVIALVS